MAKDDEAQPKRTRRSVASLTNRRTIRFSDDEERAVAAMREAMAEVDGIDLERISFSRALRTLILDKESAADLEARVQAWRERIAAGGSIAAPGTSGAVSDASIDALSARISEHHLELRRIGVNVNQIAKRVNAGDDVAVLAELEAIGTALDEMHEMLNEIERSTYLALTGGA